MNTPKLSSAVHIKLLSGGVVKDDLSTRKPLMFPSSSAARRGSTGLSGLEVRRGSAGLAGKGKDLQEVNVPSAASGGGGGGKVNRLLEMFQSNHEQPLSSPTAVSQPVGMFGGKPIPPPSKPTRRPNTAGKPNHTPSAKKLHSTVDSTTAASIPKKASGKGDGYNVDRGEVSGLRKAKVPLIPLPGNRGNFVSPSSKLSPTSTDGGGAPFCCGESSEGPREGRALEGAREEEKEGRSGKKVEQGGRGEKGREGKVSNHKMVEERKDEGASASAAACWIASKTKVLQGGKIKKMGKLQPVGVKTPSCADNGFREAKTHSEEESLKLTTAPKQLSTSWNAENTNCNRDNVQKRADSMDKASFLKAKKGGAASSPRRQHVLLKELSCEEGNDRPLAPLVTPPYQSPPKKRKTRTQVNADYENVPLNKKKTHPRTTHLSPSSATVVDQYENVQFCNRDSSDIYENVDIGFAGHGGDMSGPLPPMPPSREPVQPVKQVYENVAIKKPLKKKNKSAIVEEDDDTLFGKEGPPGNKETIYENFGPDKGHRQMTVEELEAHVETVGRKGLATEYFKIRNEPISGAHKACRYIYMHVQRVYPSAGYWW